MGGPPADQEEYFFTCPSCWQSISVLLDTSVDGQAFTEDCEICCRPLAIRYDVHEGRVNGFEVEGE